MENYGLLSIMSASIALFSYKISHTGTWPVWAVVALYLAFMWYDEKKKSKKG